jgi:hypothetical protein
MKILALCTILLASSLVSAQEPQPWSTTGIPFGVTTSNGATFTCNQNGTAGPLVGCRLASGATLDDLANAMVREQRIQQEAYARMSRRYFRCVGIIKKQQPAD